jgi:hypothetical protein
MSRNIIFYHVVSVSDYVTSKNKILLECELLFLNVDYPAVGFHAV